MDRLNGLPRRRVCARCESRAAMTHHSVAAALACALLLAPAAARAAAVPSPSPAAAVDDATQKLLTSKYALQCTAAFNPTDTNLDAGFSVLAPDFVNIDPTGKQAGRDEVVGLAKQQMKMLKAKTCDHTMESFTAPDPATIVVVNTLHVAGDMTAPDGTHALDVTDRSQDTWKSIGGKWQETQSKDLHVVIKIDGNIVQDAGS